MAEGTSTAPRPPTGSIYDLGYRHYDGVRLGRRYAAISLFSYTYWAIWGIGRSWPAKLFPIGLAVIAAVPAIVQIAVAALAPTEFDIAKPEEYYGFVSIIMALFCAFTAPELVGRDERRHTLALYFSRALSRFDYVAMKLAALALSLFFVLVVPQALLQIGNAVAADDLTDYFQHNVDLIPPILATAVLVAAVLSSLSLAIAMQAQRRAFATGAVIAVFAVLTALGSIFVNTLSGDARQFSLLISPLDLLDGAVYWIFGVTPTSSANITQKAGLDGVFYLVAALIYVAVALGVIYRRTRRMSV